MSVVLTNQSQAKHIRSVLLICSGSFLNRLPESLSNNQLAVDLLDVPGSLLRKSKFLRKFYPLQQKPGESLNEAIFRNRNWLYEQNYDYYIYADDLAMIEIARKSDDLKLKLKLLPVKKAEAIALAGSKVGFVEVAQAAKIKIPKSLVASNVSELVKLSKQFDSDYFVKADIGSGGSGIKRFNGVFDADQSDIPESWFPVVIQEQMVGQVTSVEALYDSGKLLGWVYSKFDSEVYEFGPSTRRTFLTPPSLDFEKTLIDLGEYSGFHGFANATFIYDPVAGVHYLFEADTRSNVWHQFAKRFGVDWAKLFVTQNKTATPAHPHLESQAISISIFPRELTNAINSGQLKPLWRWITNRPGTWQTRNRRDRVVNKIELAEVISAIKSRSRQLIARLFVAVWQRIPLRLRNGLEAAGVKKLLAFIFRL